MLGDFISKLGLAEFSIVYLFAIVNKPSSPKEAFSQVFKESLSAIEFFAILSIIVKRLIDLKLISYEELYILTDKQIFDLIKSCDDKIIKELFYSYQNMEKDVTPTKANIKNRKLNPLVKNIRYTNF